MDWGDLPVLLAVGRATSMTEAAELLGVNQTTVSRRIDALEESLSTRLVERSREGVKLTHAGEAAVRGIEQMEGLAFELERELLGRDARLSGNLTITTTDTLAVYEPALFSSFAERYPEIELSVSTGYQELSLNRRNVDLALRWTNAPEEQLFGRKMVRAEYAPYAAQQLAEQLGSPQRLDAFPWLAWDPGSGARVTERWMNKYVPTARIACRFDSALSMHAAVRAGAGIAFLPCAFGDLQPELTRLGEVEESFAYDIWCLTHADLAGTARVRAFLTHAGAYFKEHQARYAGKREC